MKGEEKLQIKKAFNIDDSNNKLFEHTTRGKIYAYDDNELGCSTFIENTNGLGTNRMLEILNNTNTNNENYPVTLWKIDGFVHKQKTKCDCAVLNHTRLYFVEFKSNAVRKNSQSDIYKKAADQLSQTYNATIEQCRKIGVEVHSEMERVEARVILNRTVPEDNAYKKKIVRDFIEGNGIKLRINNTVSFNT